MRVLICFWMLILMLACSEQKSTETESTNKNSLFKRLPSAETGISFINEVEDKKDFNKLLSQVCSSVYYATPVFKNELVNKHKISASIHSAKRNYFKALANNWNQENLGFEESKFPPEKTIYLSLIKENEINLGQTSNEVPVLGKNSSFNKLWKASSQFLESAKTEERNVADFEELLQERPFKLKQGFIDFWVPTFLFINRSSKM